LVQAGLASIAAKPRAVYDSSAAWAAQNRACASTGEAWDGNQFVANVLREHADDLAAFCRKRNVRELRVFGSALRDDFRADSDVDVLVELEPQAYWGLLELADAEDELARVFGRKVDLVVKDRLKWVVRDRAIASSTVLYAA